MKKGILSILLVLAIACSAFWVTADQDMRRLALNLPTSTNVLFWTSEQRDAGFRALDRLPILSKSRVIEAGSDVYPLPNGTPLDVGVDVDAFMTSQHAAALVIVQDGKVRLEKYGLDFGPEGRWTSFSVAKSFTSTLVGAAIQDGYIKSIDDMVSDYIPDLKGSAYDNVTIRQLLTMTSGVAWNEDYADPESDVARFNSHTAEPGVDVTLSYMRQLPAEAEPGTKWVYKTGETNLIGVLASSAANKPLAEYLSEKIWKPFGMQQDATWLLGSTGHEISGCCVQAATRDYARFGLFMLAGGIAGGEQVLPDGWIEQATTKQVDIGRPGAAYGYQWWTLDDGAYIAQGIFGQGIFIDPKRQLVIASNGNWPQATDMQGGTQSKDRLAFYRQVQQAIDAETP
ncbi:serine hydrolase [Halopseudomonas oceani]|uniref:serine hydrolase domain-containing protein n=1 Tax=Halopseudomonas oceani TaxID=1708783 RepID=UPI002AA7195A|nr:serine hydrolase [Halopseudomonas oceani]